MKKSVILIATVFALLTGCGADNEKSKDFGSQNPINNNTEAGETIKNENNAGNTDSLTVSFGDRGTGFLMHLYDNETAKAIAHHVGSQSWRLPIYNFNGYDNWEVMQFYDIPSKYEIPSDSQHITEEKGGEVYYSEPNRIVLFYKDAQVEGDYTPVGYFEYSEEFVKAVEENPELEGWGNKIILIEK